MVSDGGAEPRPTVFGARAGPVAAPGAACGFRVRVIQLGSFT